MPDGERQLPADHPLAPARDDDGKALVTKSGRVLTNSDIDALAEEAEIGYDVIGDPATGKLVAIKPAVMHQAELCDGRSSRCACPCGYCRRNPLYHV